MQTLAGVGYHALHKHQRQALHVVMWTVAKRGQNTPGVRAQRFSSSSMPPSTRAGTNMSRFGQTCTTTLPVVDTTHVTHSKCSKQHRVSDTEYVYQSNDAVVSNHLQLPTDNAQESSARSHASIAAMINQGRKYTSHMQRPLAMLIA